MCFSFGLLSAEQWWLLQDIKRVRGKVSATGQSLTPTQIKRLYRTLSQDKTTAGKRDYAMIALMLATGLRRAEVRDIDVHDYNVNARYSTSFTAHYFNVRLFPF